MMSDTLRVAVVQMLSTPDIAHNIARAESLIRDAASKGASFICLPENFASLGAANYREFAEQELHHSFTLNHFAKLAQDLSVYILAGSMPVLDPSTQKCLASSFLIGPDGDVLARYNKIHLFDATVNDVQANYRESDHYTPGADVRCITTPIANIGMAVCYDIRFPELFQRLRDQGANVLVLPSAFTYVTGEKHWEILLRARAIETQCYVLGINQGGRHSESRETWGHSMIVSPDGEILAQAAMGEALVIADLDFKALSALRARMPLWQHKQPFLR